MAIIDEPVRGSIPPPWFTALSGIERIRAFANGLLPLPPLFRLLGIRPAHVGPGVGTWTMPATGWLNAYALGGLELAALVETALTGVATTTLPPGVEVDPVTLSVTYFRPSRPQQGNLLARARIVNASSLFTFTEADVEDAEGRSVVRATSQSAIRRIEPPPPPPPAVLRPVEEPTYATPDPWLRPVPTVEPYTKDSEEPDGLAEVRVLADRRFPFRELHGSQLLEMSEGRMVGTLPASEWFCRFSRHVAPGVLSALANSPFWFAVLSGRRRGERPVGLDNNIRFHRLVIADGSLLRIEAQGRRIPRDGGDLCDLTVTVRAADGALVASGYGTNAYIEGSKLQKRARPEAKRILATLLFTDIVGSTEHAERLGDARWRTLLEEYRALVRSEIARSEGIEVDTAGDGFFVRFESPARALECARSAREAVKRLGIVIRAGIHTGECELQGRQLAGMAVHIAARVQAAAAPGEILASETVKAVVTGSGTAFADRGEHVLKGVPETWRLYAVVS